MSKIIEEYYAQANPISAILKQKMKKLQQHTDVLQEFEYWIQNSTYKTVNCVTVNGYSAQKIAELSEFADGETAFMLLIELRENPERAKHKISEGFRLK